MSHVTLLLAQTLPPADFTRNVLLLGLCLVSTCSGLASIYGVVIARRGMRALPQPLQVQAASEAATKADLQTLAAHFEEQARQLHGRISTLRSDSDAKLQAAVERFSDDVKALNQRVDEIPERTIALLNVTQQLHAKS